MFCQIIMYHLNQLFTGWRSDYQHLPGGKKDFKSVFSLTWPQSFLQISKLSKASGEIWMTGFFLQLYLLHFFLSLSSKRECVLTLWDLNFEQDSIPVLLGVRGRNLLCVGRRMDYWMLYNTLYAACKVYCSSFYLRFIWLENFHWMYRWNLCFKVMS